MRGLLTLAILSTLLLVALPPAHAQPETVLYNFCSQPSCADGENPASGLTPDGAGNFYGTTQLGGSNLYGTVYELSPNGVGGYNETVLYSFCSLQSCADGSFPYSYVIFDARGNLYGTTFYGGLLASGPYSGYGLVFELSPKPHGGCPSGSNSGNGWCETVLYSFTSNPDGAFPFSGLTLDASGNLYGTTYGGGSGMGTVYELSSNGKGGWSEQVIYDSGGYAGLTIDGSGNLYGADDAGMGHVFELSPDGNGGWNAIVLHSFKAGRTDGSIPQGTPVLDGAGNIYGTTFEGGATRGMGTVWKLTPGPPGQYTQNILHNFIWSYGSNPRAAVVLDSSGNIYGTTAYGIHKSPCYDGCGTLFELTKNGSNYEWMLVWNFNGTDGGNPVDTLILDGGNLYGTTYGGGKSSYCPGAGGCGVVIEMNPSARVTATTITSSPNPSTFGEPVTFTAVVTPPPPDGEPVTFKTAKVLGTAPLNGGTAMFTTSTLPVGTPHVKAVYGGDKLFEASTSKGVKQVVQR
ncbi:MAG: choice-of-anchor tandem repeat GloVer-containing protein [Terriglobales bacterium]